MMNPTYNLVHFGTLKKRAALGLVPLFHAQKISQMEKKNKTRDPRHDNKSEVLISHLGQLQTCDDCQLMQRKNPREEGYCLYMCAQDQLPILKHVAVTNLLGGRLVFLKHHLGVIYPITCRFKFTCK